MQIPRYWSRGSYTGRDRQGREHRFHATGWSHESPTAARQAAVERARRVFAIVCEGQRPAANEYEYGDGRPLCEEIIERFGPEDTPFAVVTRNRYGALVLNSANVMFVDVDYPPATPPPGILARLRWLFSAKFRDEQLRARREETLASVLDWAKRHPDRRFRLYRTCAGLRLLFVDRTYDPTASEVAHLLGELGSDELYRRLTRNQECFRARLTPKPWRCDLLRPPTVYPIPDDARGRAYQRWLEQYEEQCQRYATCVLHPDHQPLSDHPEIQQVIAIHDRYCCHDEKLPLA